MSHKARPAITVRDADIASSWTILRGLYDGRDLVARFNAAFREAEDRAAYPVQIGLAVPLHCPGEDGMPGAGEMADLDRIEEAAIGEAAGRAVLVGVITTAGMREYLLYGARTEWIGAFDEALRSRITTHTFQIMARRDTDWSLYRSFVIDR